jgi:hypothetical protein
MKNTILSVLTLRVPNRSTLVAVLVNVVLAGLVLVGVQNDLFGWVLIGVTALEVYRVWAQGEGFLAHATFQSPFWLVSLSLPVLLILNPHLVSQLVLTAAFVAWRIGLRTWQHDPEKALGIGAVTQFVSLAAIFGAAAVQRLPGLIVIILAWVASWLVATRTLQMHGERAASALAATWALIVAECSWVFSLWLVTYILPGGYVIVPQPAVVLTALGYCLAGIYAAHRKSQLTRMRLIEYLIVGLLLMSIVIAGTKWNGII